MTDLAPESLAPPRRSLWQRLDGWTWLSRVLALLVSLALARFAFGLYIENNDFPAFHHPDEGTKAGQLLSRRTEPFNFNHPLLLLRTAQWFNEYNHTRIDFWKYLIAGRSSSALLGSLTVLFMSLAGYSWRGWAGLLLCGSAVALCPSLLVFSHYFKEEPALVVGLAIALWGAALCVCNDSNWLAWAGTVIVGAGCAVCASGKYVGAIICVPGIIAVLLAGKSQWYFMSLRLLLMALVALPLFVWINAPAFEDPWTLKINSNVEQHVGEEYEHATSGHGIASLARPNRLYLQTTLNEMMPHLWVLLALGATGWAMRPRITRWGIVFIAFLLTFVIVLSFFGAIPIRRYAFPMTLLAYFASAGLFAVFIMSFKNVGVQLAVLAVGLAAIIVPQWTRCEIYNRYFLDDSRQRLHDWVAKNLPADAAIVCEAYTALEETGGDNGRFPNAPRMRQDPERVMFIPDAGSFDDLARRGIQYVVLSDPAYERYFVIDAAPIEHADQIFERYRRTYEDIFAKGELVYDDKPDPPSMSYLNPHISIYKIPSAAPRRGPTRRWFPF